MLEGLFEKFPVIELAGKRLIWDLRQDFLAVPPEQRRVYVKSFLDPETKARLLGISAAEHVTEGSPEMRLSSDAATALDFPSQKIQVIGVTGTNGKSTCVGILGQLLSRFDALPVVVIGTVGLQIYENGEVAHQVDIGFTTPEGPSLQMLFAHCAARKWKHVIMETSSQGWSLGRLAGVQMAALGFTNLTQDHLDYHGSMSAYSLAKESIFYHGLEGAGVLHRSENEFGKNFVEAVTKKLGDRVRLVDGRRDFLNLKSTLKGHEFSFGGRIYKFPLAGDHNLENLRVVFELFYSCTGEYPRPSDVAVLRSARGRLDLVPKSSRPYVYVDYAHTPDALEKSLQTLRSLRKAHQKLWVIFGCGGDRDALKRPIMGDVASKLADEVVLTSDNPRTEDPESILRQIEKGLSRPARHIEADRRAAIRWTLSEMQPDDVLLIAGKGHEEYQILGTQKVPFSDFDEVRKFKV